MKQKCKYRVGQVVSLAGLKFYQSELREREQFQRIIHIEPWPVKGKGLQQANSGYCLTFANTDRCHSKWVKPLTKREKG